MNCDLIPIKTQLKLSVNTKGFGGNFILEKIKFCHFVDFYQKFIKFYINKSTKFQYNIILSKPILSSNLLKKTDVIITPNRLNQKKNT